MSGMTFFDYDNLPEPRKGAPLPERLVEGNPTFLTWDIEKSADDKVTSGIWEVTPGVSKSLSRMSTG
ncbi:hypothetical protein [Rhizobium rhizogenes]|jgi:uncharacterized cupin superfamily protein|uniref:hypothetical protein n=1 Tax=Rhizobium rhizogenes TaxID=359 RepID=UPI00157351B2|nr:hypothetical protein [Rhizobium rhizogenes]NTG45410.1 hypothetical protein [Rhizobium rhizogenes]